MALRDLLVRIRGDKTQLDSTLKGAEGSINTFGGTVKALGGLLAAAFSVKEIINFTAESMKLAAEAEGVKNAFDRISSSAEIMKEMMKATRGAMDDSDLMQLAIKAQNFNIPLKDLSKYLEFATNRAITTGKSISELTDLIVTGLGRKSSRSFVQLGLSATDVQSAMKETGGMMRLVNEELEKMGPVSDTASVRIDALSTSFKNMKESFGTWLNQSTAVRSVIQWLTDEFKIFGDKDLSLWEKLNGSPNEYKEWKKNVEEAKRIFGGDLMSAQSFQGAWNQGGETKAVETLTTLKEKLKELDTELQNTDITNKGLTSSIRDQIKALKDQIAEIETGIHLMTQAEMAANKLIPIKSIGSGFEYQKISNNFPNLTLPSFGSKPTLPGLQKWDTTKMQQSIANAEAAQKELENMQAMNEAMRQQMELARSLEGVFDSMFSNMNKGFDGMIQGFVKGLERLAQEILAKAAVWMIMNALFPGSAIAANGIKAFIGIGSLGASTGGLGSVGTGGVSLGGEKLVTQLSGKTIDIVLKRHYEDN